MKQLGYSRLFWFVLVAINTGSTLLASHRHDKAGVYLGMIVIAFCMLGLGFAMYTSVLKGKTDAKL